MNCLNQVPIKLILLGWVANLTLTGCIGSTGSNQENLPELKTGEAFSKFNMNAFSVNKLVCDPFDGVGTTDLVEGLHAKLWHLREDQPRYTKVQDYIDHGQASTNEFFFSEVHVSTRLFTEGFPSLVGGRIKTDQGEDLIEYFALEFNGGLRLGPDDLEGEYELALLSDDGAIMSLAQSDSDIYEVVVNNDGNHPTRMGCGQRVTFNNNTQFKVKFQYYQGPKMHISMIPLWRRVTADTRAEPQCGKLGNSMYFDYNDQSKP
ncbi:MAG: hypothetical protein GW917_03330, partial [Bdellovibrionales bacterium]|nr:hypothetical protein [Bdellovibrionales bacterium]